MTTKPKLKITLRFHFVDGEVLTVSDAQESSLFSKCDSENSVVHRLEQTMRNKNCDVMFDRVVNFSHVTNAYFHVQEMED